MATSDRTTTALLSLALVSVGAFAWWLQLAPSLRVDTSALAGLPMEIGDWRSEDLPMESSVESILSADQHVQRLFWHPSGAYFWFYVGYYGTARGGRPEHTPRGCYTGAGWGIESTRTLVVDADRDFRVNEWIVERKGEKRLVHFYYRSHRRTGMLGGLDQNVDRLLGRLQDRRADGALVRLSTRLEDDDVVSARTRLVGAAAELDPIVAEHWPEERAT